MYVPYSSDTSHDTSMDMSMVVSSAIMVSFLLIKIHKRADSSALNRSEETTSSSIEWIISRLEQSSTPQIKEQIVVLHLCQGPISRIIAVG